MNFWRSQTVLSMMPMHMPYSKVAVLLSVLDYPGIGKVLGVVGSGGLHKCAFCSLQGEQYEVLHKTVYMQNRRYLPSTSPLRKDTVKYVVCTHTWSKYME